MNTLNKNENSFEKKWELVNFCEFDQYATKSYCAIHNESETKNLGDITKVDETKLEPFTMICGGSPCFMAGTKVITSKGYKNIEDITVGDYVLTHQNRFMPVVKIGGEKNKEIYSLRVQGFLETECTDYHPFYCKKDKKSNPEKIKLKDLKVGYYLGSHINKNKINEFDLTNEDCWILGRYVADGRIRKEKRKERNNSFQYQCILSIGDDKVDDLKNIIKSRHFSCYPHSQSTHRVAFSSMELVNFIINHGFGMGAENKVIPNFILDLPVDKLECFLNGYMAGDGCEIDNVYQATTVSKELAMTLCLAIQKVYRVGCYIYYDKRPDTYVIEGREVNQKDTYMIRFRKNPQKHLWFIDEDIVWYPIREIRKTDKIESVFNIEVEEDHTYTANNIITYNCQDFSVAGKQKGSVWTCKDCGHEYNPLTVHWSERHKCPNCGSENLEKTRSSLLVEYLRVIRANKPNFGMYENVKNIVGKQFKETTFKLFTDELEEYGYNVYWKVLNAKNYGIPQNRERVYLIFIRKDVDNGKFKFPDPFDNGVRLKDILEDEVDEKYYISEDKVQRFLTNLNNKDALLYDACQIKREDKAREYNDFCPTLTARDYKDPKLVNDSVVTTRNSDVVSCLRSTYYKNGARNMLQNIENGRGYEGVVIRENTVKQLGNIVNTGNWDNPQRGRIYSPDGCSPALNCCGGGGLEPKIVQVGGRQPHILQGIDKSLNQTKCIDVANCLTTREDRGISNRKSEGTAVMEYDVPNTPKCLETPDYSYCLDANYYKGTTIEHYVEKHKMQLVSDVVKIPQATKKGYIECEVGGVADLSYPESKTRRGRVQENDNVCPTLTATETGVCRIESPIRIRKLTPKECFRLMGFSDKNFEAAANVVSNSQLYKQAGNSIVSDVLYYILRELYIAMPYLFDDLRLSSFFSGIGAFEIALNRLYEGINSGNFTNPQAE